MGAAMARRLADSGYSLVVWNRDREKAEQVSVATGAEVAQSASDAAGKGDIVISSLADDAALRHVYLGPQGIVAGVRAHTVIVDTSTVDPETVVEVGAAVDQTGAGFVDSPVSGSVATVEAGALTLMAGGDLSDIDQARPVLEAISSKVVHTGVRGTGAATKLAVNALVHGLNIALSEALVLAEKAGVDRATAYEVFASGAGGAPFVQYKRDAYQNPESAPVAFTLDLVAKDLELITGLARRVGAEMKQANTGLQVVDAAISAGFGDRDLSAIAVYLRGEQA